MPTELTRVKNDFGTIHRTPLAPPSCFTARFTSIAKRVAVAMDHRSSAIVPSAQGLCQTRSVPQIVCLFCSSAAMAQQGKHGLPVVSDNTFRQTDGHSDGNTSVDVTQAPLQSAGDGL